MWMDQIAKKSTGKDLKMVYWNFHKVVNFPQFSK